MEIAGKLVDADVVAAQPIGVGVYYIAGFRPPGADGGHSGEIGDNIVVAYTV